MKLTLLPSNFLTLDLNRDFSQLKTLGVTELPSSQASSILVLVLIFWT